MPPGDAGTREQVVESDHAGEVADLVTDHREGGPAPAELLDGVADRVLLGQLRYRTGKVSGGDRTPAGTGDERVTGVRGTDGEQLRVGLADQAGALRLLDEMGELLAVVDLGQLVARGDPAQPYRRIAQPHDDHGDGEGDSVAQPARQAQLVQQWVEFVRDRGLGHRAEAQRADRDTELGAGRHEGQPLQRLQRAGGLLVPRLGFTREGEPAGGDVGKLLGDEAAGAGGQRPCPEGSVDPADEISAPLVTVRSVKRFRAHPGPRSHR